MNLEIGLQFLLKDPESRAGGRFGNWSSNIKVGSSTLKDKETLAGMVRSVDHEPWSSVRSAYVVVGQPRPKADVDTMPGTPMLSVGVRPDGR